MLINHFRGSIARLGVGLAILSLAIFLPRLLPFSPSFSTFDEITVGGWVNQMARAIVARDWRNTVNNAYPAVTLAWLEVIQLPTSRWWPEYSPDYSHPLTERELFVFFARQRFIVAAINGFIVIGILWLLKHLYNQFIAVAAILLIAFDPFLLSQSRVFRTDGLAAGLMTLSALTLMLYAQQNRRRWLAASAILGSLAALTKITSIYLVPFAVLFLLAGPALIGVPSYFLKKSFYESLGITAGKNSFRQSAVHGLWSYFQRGLVDFLIWGLIWATMLFLLWPALWVAPVETAWKIWQALQQVRSLHSVWGNQAGLFFFQGQVINWDPGVSFYLWSLAYRTTPLVWLGGVILIVNAFYLWLSRFRRTRLLNLSPLAATTLFIAAYVIFYFGAMSLMEAKVDRYLLPIFPALSILAAVGFQQGVEMLLGFRPAGESLKNWAAWGVLLVGSAWIAFPHHPYYSTFWNPLLGGGPSAIKVLPAGSGEGTDLMVDALNKLPDVSKINLFRLGPLNCRLIFAGNCLDEVDFMRSDYFITSLFSRQAGFWLANVEQIIPQVELVDKYTVDGVDYARLYKIPKSSLHSSEEWLGSHGRFMGYALSDNPVGAGDTLELTLFWLNGDQGWTLDDSEFFVELSDKTGQTQQVAPALVKSELNPLWPYTGEIVILKVQLPLNRQTPLGEYEVGIGLRLKATAQETWRFTLANTVNTISVNRGSLNIPVETLTLQHRLNAPVGDTGLTLLGYDDLTQAGNPRFDLYWQAAKPLTQDYVLQLVLLDAHKQIIAGWRNFLSPPTHPITIWQPGEVVSLFLPLDLGYALPPANYQPVLSILPAENSQTEPLLVANLPPLAEDFLPRRPAFKMQQVIEGITFNPGLDLLGYDLVGQKQTGGGGSLEVTLYWLYRQPLEPVEVEIQVLDQGGGTLASKILPVTAPAGSSWESVSRCRLSLTGLPASLIIRNRPVGSESWSETQLRGKPTHQQAVIIDNILDKIMVVAD